MNFVLANRIAQTTRPSPESHSAAIGAHRQDIDGLRAVAVILVILFHLHAPHVPGGFVGVDVFFVISGYLLTAIIVRDIELQRFSVARFYERRARRILPAFIGMVIPVSIIAFVYLLPGDLIAYAKSLAASALSFSNIYFAATSGYFDAPAQSRPLLHTWSLGVEEQFYVVLPLLLMVLAKQSAAIRNSVIISLAVLSFAWSIWSSLTAPIAAFYLPQSRAWELMLGSILALELFPKINRRWMVEIVAMVGLAMIAVAAAFLSTATPFPGIAALLPCVGSAFVLAAGRYGTPFIGKMLSWKPIVAIGLISYSTYLWHWPLIVYAKMGFISGVPHRLVAPAVIILSTLCGAASWKFIEQPFRFGKLRRMSRRSVFAVSGTAIGVCTIVAALAISNNGFGSRFPAEAVNVAQIMNVPQQMQDGTCLISSKYRFEDFRKNTCLHVDPSKKNYLLLGDSHAAALWFGLAHDFASAHILQATTSGCMPRINPVGSRDCRRMMTFAFQDVLPKLHVDAVILSARWWTEREFSDMAPTIAWFDRHKTRIVIVGPVMEYDSPLPRLLAYGITYHDPTLARQHLQVRMFAMDRYMKSTATAWHIPYVSLMSAQCPSQECASWADKGHSIPLMNDDNHLSNAGSAYVIAITNLAEKLH